jgi:hypothetical protein
MSHRSCMGKIAIYSTGSVTAILLNHLAACCSTSSVPGFSEVFAVATTVHLISETSENLQPRKSILFSYLGLESPVLSLLFTPHA